ncbi:unnamed protein product, partial [Protopolystoma xenopodis]
MSNTANDPFDSDKMAVEFNMQFADTPLSVGQSLLFKFSGKIFIVEVRRLAPLMLSGGDSDVK